MNPAIVSRLVACVPFGAEAGEAPRVRFGSKTFTESVVLGELITQLARHAGGAVRHRAELGGTQVLFNALKNGDIDAYPEYTGTINQEIFAGKNLAGTEDIRRELGTYGIGMSDPLGFSNNYVLGMRKDRAAELGVTTISDLRDHPDLVLGFSNEFLNRGDGWPSLKRTYGLPQEDVRGMQHDIAYRGVDSGAIDVIDLYSTDPEIAYYDLATLDDDRKHFPDYAAVILYRAELESRTPEVIKKVKQLAGALSEERMIELNKRAKIDRVPAGQVASDFLAERFDIQTEFTRTHWLPSLWRRTREHLGLVIKSMVPAILVAVPLGILAVKMPRAAQGILAAVGVIQTIPALALLVLLMTALQPLRRFGIETVGAPPAIVALFMYSLLPIVRNTYTGLQGIPGPVAESAAALGLPFAARLRLIELPLALPTILAGIKTAVVINVGFATLGALIGAGGYGQPILTGIRLDDTGLILQGAIPAALLALAMQALFELIERVLVPKGLRLRPER